MKYEINIDKLGETLSSRATAANRETIKYYGCENASFENRRLFAAQARLVRDLDIPLDLATDEEDGKELYTAITIAGKVWTI